MGILEDNGAMLYHDAMPVLQRDGFDPGQSNRDLGREAWALFLNQPLNIFAQWEVAYAMWETNPAVYDQLLGKTGLMHILWPRGTYYPTWEVKQDSIKQAAALGLSRPIELAHPDMLARAVVIIWRLGLCPSPFVASIAYDPESIQSWTISPDHWWLRNLLGHVHHILHRWVRFNPPRQTQSSG
jgi:hypothetical protein